MCFYCHLKIVKKSGRIKGVQRYRCHGCHKQFLNRERIDTAVLWKEYTEGKQTYAQLALKYGCSTKTIQRSIDNVQTERRSSFASVANVVMDITYFGRGFGVMVLKDSLTGCILLKQYVKYKTNKLSLAGIAEITRRGMQVQAIICDGRKGLFTLFGVLPVQMCQFHQVQIMTRYLTQKPKTPAGVELRDIALQLTKLDKAAFTAALAAWQLKWEGYLKERTLSPQTGKSHYTHKRLRSAWLSLKRNLLSLFTFEVHATLKMPNTSQALDGCFSDLKNKLRNHNGMSETRKKKFIDEFFKA